MERDEVVGKRALAGVYLRELLPGDSQRGSLPSVVVRSGDRRGADKSSDPGARLDQALGDQCPQGFLHGHRTERMLRNQLSG